ncbi:MAG: dienelactone hydrolase family protein [Burkholderiales bacterium]|nr:dienelactone hydrolase family protein [Burkholderiales bacterium]
MNRFIRGWYLLSALALMSGMVLAADVPETVVFPSRDGKTQIKGFLFKPEKPGPYPAVVMLHGRAGPYSSLAQGVYTAETLTMRHKMWGAFWAERGYLALHVDSFGPRGFPQGFPKNSYRDRPSEVSEQDVRPLDAYGALDYLRQRNDVVPDRVGLLGWSNGGMTLLSALAQDFPGMMQPAPARGFRAAIALYPSCRIQSRQSGYRPYAPLLILAAADDDEVSPLICRDFAAEARGRDVDLDFVLYEGAHHGYDDPGRTKQSHPHNRAATQDSLLRADRFFHKHLQP